jgi:hypothetical protein
MRQLLLISIVALSVLSCSGTKDWVKLNAEPDVEGTPLHFVGTVTYVDIEGGVFAIRGSDGTQYNPINLPDSFKTDGMVVEAEARQRDDLVSPAMIGPMIELLRIRRR